MQQMHGKKMAQNKMFGCGMFRSERFKPAAAWICDRKAEKQSSERTSKTSGWRERVPPPQRRGETAPQPVPEVF